ncbi:MAG: polymer-forming cytoskeletal protein [Spirochaetaceae bacterium]|nr:polymer-forming cytoskeletal protein [Spirochaetaceae bacterium]MDT8299733.1 polymer-forming cytoskeletal protein [Spirochaetaceae bacterium]
MPRRTENPVYRARTVLGGETKFSGILKFQDSLKIDGRFEGAIESPGFLIIENGAEVVADIHVGSLIVGGVIKGDVIATERLELLPGGSISGNIRCPSLVMAEGTGIQGRCEMLADPGGVDIFSMPLDRLKKSLPRVG